MKVRSLMLFNDLKAKKLRKIGEEFEATAKRVEELNSTYHGFLVEVIEENKRKPIKKKVGD